MYIFIHCIMYPYNLGPWFTLENMHTDGVGINYELSMVFSRLQLAVSFFSTKDIRASDLFTKSLLGASSSNSTPHGLRFCSLVVKDPAMKVNWTFGSHPAHEQDKIKSKQGSIRVGATGKVSTLMTRELDQVRRSSSNHVSRNRNTQDFPVTVCCGESRRQAFHESGNTRTSTGQRTESRQKQQHNMRHNGCDIPVFASEEDVSVQRKAARDEKRRPQYIEVVDLKCGTSLKKAWSRHTRKNGSVKFSRLSVSD